MSIAGYVPTWWKESDPRLSHDTGVKENTHGRDFMIALHGNTPFTFKTANFDEAALPEPPCRFDVYAEWSDIMVKVPLEALESEGTSLRIRGVRKGAKYRVFYTYDKSQDLHGHPSPFSLGMSFLEP